jgi:hypothetical protein
VKHTERDFEQLSWHDCHVWGIELRVGEPDEDDWSSDLVLRLDYIVEWLCGVGEPAEFRVAPAELVFHGVTEPHIEIPWTPPAYQVAIYLPSIDRIDREPVADQKVFLDRTYYSWRIHLNRPAGGVISLGAVGFTQAPLGEPLVTPRQHLTRSERDRALQSLERADSAHPGGTLP